MAKKLKPRKKKSIVTVLRIQPWGKYKIYTRKIDLGRGKAMFEWLVIDKDHNLYSSYMIVTPRKGTSKLSDLEVTEAEKIVFYGAMSTVEAIGGENAKSV